MFAFGEPDGSVWGGGWIPADGPGAAALQAGGEVQIEPLVLDGLTPGESWRATSGGSEFELEGVGEPASRTQEAEVADADQLCRFTGTLQAGQTRRTVSCLGWRSSHTTGLEGEPGGSFRLLAGWFDSSEGFALLAQRARDGKGHERDEITAGLLGSEDVAQVVDARLSTTYASSGRPIRAGVELWVQLGEDPEQQYPRRILGEALKPPVELSVQEVALWMLPLRWHRSAGQGCGIYLLGTWPASAR